MASGLETCQQLADAYTVDEDEGGGELGNPSSFIIRKNTGTKQQGSCGWLFEDSDRQRGGERETRASTSLFITACSVL